MRTKYTTRYAPDHPLATKRGIIPAHRVVLYEKIGPGPHPCHWCGRMLNWAPGEGRRPGALCVDHLDDDGLNNDPANLVPSCHGCNIQRGHGRTTIRQGEAAYVRPTGIRERLTEAICPWCGKVFHRLAWAKKDLAVHYCSRSCAASGRPRRVVTAR